MIQGHWDDGIIDERRFEDYKEETTLDRLLLCPESFFPWRVEEVHVPTAIAPAQNQT
jgi:hypothetical protein